MLGRSSAGTGPQSSPGTPFPLEVGRGAPSVYLWGESRRALNLVLFAMAHRLDAHLYWIEVGEVGSAVVPSDPVARNWVEPGHVYPVDQADELRPDTALGNLALSNVIRADEPAAMAVLLTDFLRLPASVQDVLSRATPEPGMRVLTIANSERLTSFYAEDPSATRHMMEVLRLSQVALLVSRAGGPGPHRRIFDYVFEVRLDDVRSWRRGEIVCEHGITRGPFAVGTAHSLAALPDLAGPFLALERSGEIPRS